MKQGSRIRAGLAAATLLAQLVLPVAHGFSDQSVAAPIGPVVAVVDASHLVAAHDPSLCPVCVAVCQARTGVGLALPDASLPLDCELREKPIDGSVALPRAPDLGTAPPRAPPLPSPAFA